MFFGQISHSNLQQNIVVCLVKDKCEYLYVGLVLIFHILVCRLQTLQTNKLVSVIGGNSEVAEGYPADVQAKSFS